MNESKDILKRAFCQKLKVQQIEHDINHQKKINQESRGKIIQLSSQLTKEYAALMELIKV